MNVKEIMKRQSELAEKIAKGEATASDYDEVKRLNQMILDVQRQAEEPAAKSELDTDLVVMTGIEFKEYCDKAETSADERELKLLMQNISRVEAQQAKGKDVFAVEVPVSKEEPMDVGLIDVLAAIADLKATLDKRFTTDGRTTSGLRQDEEEEGEEKEQEEAEKALSPRDIFTKWLQDVVEMKDKAQAGNLTKDDIAKLVGAEAIDDLEKATEIMLSDMAKHTDAVEALGIIVPILQEMEKLATEATKDDAEEKPAEEGEEVASAEATTEDVGEEQAEEKSEEQAEKDTEEDAAVEGDSDEVDSEEETKTEKSSINWDGDLAAPMAFKSVEEEYAHLRKANNR